MNGLRIAGLMAAALLALGMTGCLEGDDGAAGAPGAAGAAGAAGTAGVNCWDLNGNGTKDFPAEDTDGNGVIDVNDCRAPSGAYDPAGLHKGYFTEKTYTGTQSCLDCHGKIADDVMTTGHWNWQGVASKVTGFEGEIHGKTDFINNFCVAVPTNEGRCTECHIGLGWKDKTFNFGNPRNVDCLVCHDQTGTYKKGQTIAGLPDPSVDLQAVARSVGQAGGVPTRKACLYCHAYAGGGDNVKHGDLSSDQAATTREYDVHLGTDGANMTCVACHDVKRDSEGKVLSHGIGGMPYHSVDEGTMKGCSDCHGDRYSIHAGTSSEFMINLHPRLACQSCHVPGIARKIPTKVNWKWGDAGQDVSPIPTDPATGMPLYDKKKGTFQWGVNVRPSLLYADGRWNKVIMNRNDRYMQLPAVLAAPTAQYTDPAAMIYPFKKMIGNQPADKNNKTILVPHLFGTAGGPNPYWGKFNWNLALQDGAAYTGQTYTGEYEFVDTIMYVAVNHEIAPKEKALGYDRQCTDCHGAGKIDWAALGWSGDPTFGGKRP